MPFFSTASWMTHAARFWLWIVLTVPSTGLAILFYKYWRNRRDHKQKKNPNLKHKAESQKDNNDLEMNPLNGGLATSSAVNGNVS